MKLNSLAIAATMIAVIVTTACQTGRPVTVAEAPSALSGEWSGTLSDSVTQTGRFTITANAGTLTGKVILPNSRVKTEQTFSGTFDGSAVKFKTDANWSYDLTLSKSDDGTYNLNGIARGGTSSATVNLKK